MRPRTCFTCTHCALVSMRFWRAKDATGWLGHASTFCPIVFCLISRAGGSKTSSRISRAIEEGGIFSLPVHHNSAAAVWEAAPVGREPRGRPDLDVAQRVIRAEIEGLDRLAAGLDGAFEAAVSAFAAVRGRIVVTGIGKSGHVGRKIAATLASTGSPAQFVHPVEASHGDLGMIGCDDAVLVLSNSGETSELADIVAYSRRFEIPLVAITGGASSTL